MGVLDRLVLSDGRWERISRHIIGDERTRGSSGRDNRMFVEAVLRVVRTGSPWRDLPEAFGNWNSAFRLFSHWSEKGIRPHVFAAMADEPVAAGDRSRVAAGRDALARGGGGGTARSRSLTEQMAPGR